MLVVRVVFFVVRVYCNLEVAVDSKMFSVEANKRTVNRIELFTDLQKTVHNFRSS